MKEAANGELTEQMNRAGELDDLDLDIIEHLRREPRMPNTTLARKIGVSAPTLYSRLHELHDQHVCEVRAQIDFNTAGYHRLAFVDLYSSSRPAEEIAEEVSRHKECTGLMLFNDDPKIVAAFLAPDDQRLSALIANDLASIAGVTRISTHIALRIIRYGVESGEIGVDRHEPLPQLKSSLVSDSLDLAILETLRNDARLSNREVARILDVSESAVRKRLARLISQKVLQFSLVCAPAKLGKRVWGYVRLAVAPRRIKSILALLSEHASVETIYEMSGPWPIHFFGTFATDDALRALLHYLSEYVQNDAEVSARSFKSIKHNCDYVKVL